MIKGYALFGRVDDSKRLFLETPGKSLICLNMMIHVLCKTGEFIKLWIFLKKIEKKEALLVGTP